MRAPQVELLHLPPRPRARAAMEALRDQYPGYVSIDGTVSDVAMFGYPKGKRPAKFKPLPSMYDMAASNVLVVTRAELLPQRIVDALQKHTGPLKVVLVFSAPEEP